MFMMDKFFFYYFNVSQILLAQNITATSFKQNNSMHNIETVFWWKIGYGEILFFHHTKILSKISSRFLLTRCCLIKVWFKFVLHYGKIYCNK